jgi:transcription-repair coupling factor (superfamily II helicase)
VLALSACSGTSSAETAAVVDEAQLADIEAELVDRYGAPPEPARNLLEVARLRTVARAAGIGDISLQGNHVRFGPLELPESQQLRLQRLYPGSIIKHTLNTILVPKPMTARVAGRPLRDREVLTWAGDVIRSVVMDNVGQAARVATART